MPGIDGPVTPTVAYGAGHNLWMVGAHGGAGTSTLARLSPTWGDAGTAWPLVAGQPQQAIVVARTNAAGLIAARRAITEWASGTAPVALVGLALMADAPGRLPRHLRDLAHVVSGGVPRTWQLPWVDALRIDPDLPLTAMPRELQRFVADLTSTTNPTL